MIGTILESITITAGKFLPENLGIYITTICHSDITVNIAPKLKIKYAF